MSFVIKTIYVCSGDGEEIDLMLQYNTNPTITNENNLIDITVEGSKLAISDMHALLNGSLIQLNVSCGQARCQPCINSVSCQDGLKCSLFR